ncbi:MAG: hemolysin activation protein [Bacteroidaceae bacterium]|nr:hemolysin activation protein [Bacteroidaceae bacterium]
MKHEALVDVSVLLLFHARADHFGQVWQEVKRARPARLFLYQDGPRGEQDEAGIQACRALVADDQIDWECEVHRLYQEKNYGCDPSEYISQRWAFSLTDKCIVLEDDDVPSQTFFTFCKEMLDRYADDPRVTMIAGFNTDEKSPVEADYFFTQAFSIWGWASWARVVNDWDGEYAWLDDPEQVRRIEEIVRRRKYRSEFLEMCRQHKASGKEYYETIFWSYLLLHDGLAVMPRVNMISNVGMDSGTHYSGSLATTPRGLRRIFTMGRHDLTFPLRHPAEVAEDFGYKERYYRVNAWGHPWVKVGRSLEELFLNLRYGNFATIGRAIAARIKKTLGLKKHR